MSTITRETKQVQVGDHTLEVKTYATAREVQAIQQAYFKGSKVDVVGGEPRLSEFNTGAQFEVEHEMIRQLVISLDGSTEDVVGRSLDLPSEVYSELVEYLDTLASKKKK